jgi:hypothetical protein
LLIIRFENVQHAVIRNNKVSGDAAAFVKIEGTGSKDIRVTNNKTGSVKKAIEWPAGVAINK